MKSVLLSLCMLVVFGTFPTNTQDMRIQKSYIYANGQILTQHNGPHTAAMYFYLHDRLGSVRQVINNQGQVRNYYTYPPFGEVFAAENTENVSNPFKFTGQLSQIFIAPP